MTCRGRFHRVHWAGSGAVGFSDGDDADEHGPAQYLRYSTIAGASAGPSVPSRAAEGARRGTPVHSRSRARRAHTGSSSQEPAPDHDESDEEAVSPQSESSQDGDEAGDGSGSDSGSGADGGSSGPSSRKRTRRASRS
ncbi:hypothetical protein CsSME_00032039 [Camellia sinensis var. sinensis]